MEIMYKPDKVAGVSHQLCMDTQLLKPVLIFISPLVMFFQHKFTVTVIHVVMMMMIK